MHSPDPSFQRIASSLGVVAILLAPLAAASEERVVAAAPTSRAALPHPRWRSVVPPRDRDELALARLTEETWTVEQKGNEVEVRWQAAEKPRLEKPASSFRIDGAMPPLRGLCTGDGWLLGFDSGERGGSLWWFRHDGKALQHLADENVCALFESSAGLFAFCGLEHAESETGSLLRIERDEVGAWTSRTITELGALPRAVLEESSESWLAVTSGAVLRVYATGAVERIVESRAFALAPVSIAVDERSIVWIGMRRYLVRLTPFGRSYREDWFVKADD
jgi:hypothetical protein